RPKPASIEIEPDPADPAPPASLPNALVIKPAPLQGVQGWTVLPATGHTGNIYAVAYNPSGDRMASGGDDGLIRLWDPHRGKLVRILYGHLEAVKALTWSPDGKYLASCGADKTVRLWAAGSGLLLRTLKGHSQGVNGLSWSPDGTRL